jgi:hypothetical protein
MIFILILLLLVEVSLLVLEIWSWRGKAHHSRWWLHFRYMNMVILVLIPTLLFLVVGFPMTLWSDHSNNELLGIIGLIFVLLGCIVGTYSFFIGLISIGKWSNHKAWGPRWHVKMRPKKLEDMRLDSPWEFIKRGRQQHITPPMPRWYSWHQSLWTGRRVLDPDTSERPDRLSARGCVDGDIRLGYGGVWFRPGRLPADWQQRAFTATPWSDFIGATVVPPRAGTDGIPRPGRLHRSPWRRLVLETVEGKQLYEVHWRKADEAAAMITRLHQKYLDKQAKAARKKKRLAAKAAKAEAARSQSATSAVALHPEAVKPTTPNNEGTPNVH